MTFVNSEICFWRNLLPLVKFDGIAWNLAKHGANVLKKRRLQASETAEGNYRSHFGSSLTHVCVILCFPVAMPAMLNPSKGQGLLLVLLLAGTEALVRDAADAVGPLVERFEIEPFPDFSAK